MTTTSSPIQPILQNAAAALERGDKRAARHWAQMAASLAPQSEEPWLILAAVSEPRASLAYLQQALLLNPDSERALRGLRWAQSRLAKQQTTAAELTQPAKPAEITKPVKLAPPPAPALDATQPTRLQATVKQINPKGLSATKTHIPAKLFDIRTYLPGQETFRVFHIFLPVILLALLCLALAWTVWPASASLALSLIRSGNPAQHVADGPSGPQVEIAQATDPAVARATATPTTSTVPTATPAATSTSTPLPTPTALPTDSGGYAPPPVVGTQPAPGGRKYILVSISEQHLYAYQDNILVSSFVASTGMNNATRAGVFQVLDKIPNAYGATWNIWMPNWLGIYYSGSLENGIHALPILSNGARLWAGYLGTPISFGCIVLGVEESQWLYNWADVGTTVEIRR